MFACREVSWIDSGSPGGLPISSLLEQHIDDLTILVDRPPQVPVLASDSNEDIINEERAAVATVPSRAAQHPGKAHQILWNHADDPEAGAFDVGDEVKGYSNDQG